MILDSGALIAIERDDRRLHALLLAALEEGDEIATHPMVVAQVWRHARGRQARLARFLRGIHIVPIDDPLGRRCGELLGASKTSDPIDAAVVLIAHEGSAIVTSDPDDVRHLARAAKRTVTIVAC
jgi:predicted nucleic acid-binding protein